MKLETDQLPDATGPLPDPKGPPRVPAFLDVPVAGIDPDLPGTIIFGLLLPGSEAEVNDMGKWRKGKVVTSDEPKRAGLFVVKYGVDPNQPLAGRVNEFIMNPGGYSLGQVLKYVRPVGRTIS